MRYVTKVFRHIYILYMFSIDLRDFVQFLFVFTLVDHSPITLGHGRYVYPDWADGLGWLMFAVVVLLIPLIAIIHIVRARQAHPFLSITVSHRRASTSCSLE